MLSLKSFQSLITTSALLWSSAVSFPQIALAQGPKTTRGALYQCMKAAFPEFDLDPSDANRGFDPKSGRNFVFEKDHWVDVKTGKFVCPENPSAAAQQPQTGTPFGSVPPVKLNTFDQRILNIHNAERSAVGVPPLRWNPALEASATAYAQQLARTGQLVHAPREGRGIERENLLSAPIGWSADRMIQVWTGEKRYFHAGYFPNVCNGDWTQCAHYTQTIWPTTTDLGCGMAPGGGFNWLVCRYSPGGNKDGEPVGRPAYRPERG